MTSDALLARLQSAFPDGLVQVFDLTGGGDHYEVSIESGLFAGLTRIQQHQKVMQAVESELKSGEVHALSIKTKTRGGL